MNFVSKLVLIDAWINSDLEVFSSKLTLTERTEFEFVFLEDFTCFLFEETDVPFELLVTKTITTIIIIIIIINNRSLSCFISLRILLNDI